MSAGAGGTCGEPGWERAEEGAGGRRGPAEGGSGGTGPQLPGVKPWGSCFGLGGLRQPGSAVLVHLSQPPPPRAPKEPRRVFQGYPVLFSGDLDLSARPRTGFVWISHDSAARGGCRRRRKRQSPSLELVVYIRSCKCSTWLVLASARSPRR